ncbi:MAG: Crp/Fnr family transcriptional regulator [Hoeflea sp.]|uniref:Crp/Fnr family transcriptional regulator n=1 Tax=Hoeflea sp. TaxID=1940281 RepID=UPI001D617338|nr:Crp/Fnr family transcriptional regulator [Hoeflea sp.]MBU4527083.1 Crp/Fnr family transcriptional regulator [Alphaproteobacteria bacterium]MBU4547042.1 Crp/Fnr family transcriptional regulator [Alphaproteobacteria bacterium]MBU4553336.1 Crp/Fnr family transcriptional regulator [Alphaproteobacteria bacterium]MBV1721820.1 Crp/Fnr family transcriptional regulator [Hoeflea sp.]MBV1783205.1 Crp/Fnr family transcriptional regulator [Hoeflea sp.]
MNRTAEGTCQFGQHDDCAGFNRTMRRAGTLAALEHFNLISHHRKYPRGSIIQAQGEIGGMVGHIVDGVVKLTRISVNGNEHIVGLEFPSGFFGQLFAGEMRFSYEAATDVTLSLVTRPAFERFFVNHPAVEHEMLKAKLDELDAVREWAAITNGHTTIQRLASLLYVFAKRAINQTSDEAATGRSRCR